MSEEVKSITLSGTAASEYMGGAKKKTAVRRKTRKVQMEGGSDEEGEVIMTPAIRPPPQVISVNVAAPLPPPPPRVTNAVKTNAMTAPSNAVINAVKTNTTEPSNTVSLPAPTEGGATTKQIKVELKKRPTAKRVHLQPKKPAAPLSAQKKAPAPTRRIRRFTLGLSSLQKRLTRAKKLQKKVEDMPLDKLKELLVQKKLIKPTSKAPESVLRQIAADAQIVAGKAL